MNHRRNAGLFWLKKNVLLETEARQFMFEIVGVEIFSLNTKQFS